MRYGIKIEYNFYQSYYGHNRCDAAASHAKKRITNNQRNTDIPAQTAIDLVNSINTLRNTLVLLAPIIEQTIMKVSPIKEIKSFFKYTFPAPGEIHAYDDSATPNPTKIYRMDVRSFPLLTA